MCPQTLTVNILKNYWCLGKYIPSMALYYAMACQIHAICHQRMGKSLESDAYSLCLLL